MGVKVEDTFENSLKRLEKIVQSLEDDAPSLDEALQLFEEGKALIAKCLKKLDEADRKLKILSDEADSQ